MATLEPACPNCGEMMLDGRSHLNCQSRRERIASLERTIGEQADQIGGLTSELERTGRLETDLVKALTAVGIEGEHAPHDLVPLLENAVFVARQQLAASQAEAAALRDILRRARTPSRFFPKKVSYCPVCDQGETVGEIEHQPHEPDCIIGQALATPSAAAGRVQALEEVAKWAKANDDAKTARTNYMLLHGNAPKEMLAKIFEAAGKLRAALAALDAATVKEQSK